MAGSDIPDAIDPVRGADRKAPRYAAADKIAIVRRGETVTYRESRAGFEAPPARSQRWASIPESTDADVRHRQPRLRGSLARRGADGRGAGRRVRTLQAAGASVLHRRHRRTDAVHRRPSRPEAREIAPSARLAKEHRWFAAMPATGAACAGQSVTTLAAALTISGPVKPIAGTRRARIHVIRRPPPVPPRASPTWPTNFWSSRRATGAMWEMPRATWSTRPRRNTSPRHLAGTANSLAFGATLGARTPPTESRSGAANLRKHNVTKSSRVPTVLKNLIELVEKKSGEPATARGSSSRLSASEKMPPEIFEEFHGCSAGAARFDRPVPRSPTSGSSTRRRCQAREPRQAGVRLQASLIAPTAATSRKPTYLANADQEQKRLLLLLAQVREIARDLYRRLDPHGDNLTFDEDGFFWFSGRNTTCSRSRACGCRRSTLRRR